MRPHQLDFGLESNGGNEFRATVVHINWAGPKVKVELVSEWGDPVFAEIDHDRLDALKLQKGQRVYARPEGEPARFRVSDLIAQVRLNVNAGLTWDRGFP